MIAAGMAERGERKRTVRRRGIRPKVRCGGGHAPTHIHPLSSTGKDAIATLGRFFRERASGRAGGLQANLIASSALTYPTFNTESDSTSPGECRLLSSAASLRVDVCGLEQRPPLGDFCLRQLPARTCGSETSGLTNIRSMWPPSRSCIAGAAPRYVTNEKELPVSF
jgi:hypothetical protein